MRNNLLLTLGCWAALASIGSGLPAAEPSKSKVNDGFDISTGDWPWWRGPWRNGSADAAQTPPMSWSQTTNVLWKAAVSGRGYGSPMVYGERVFLATANEDSGEQSLLCFARATGKQLWRTVVHPSGGMRKNNKATAASSTPACDGERVFINFPNDGALYTTALNLEGKRLWQKKISDYVVHQGYGSSPALYQHLVIVSADNKGGGALAALDRETGQIVWRRERPRKPNYPSPILLHAAGRDQLLMTGCDMIVSYAPLTGETLWETPGATTECVTSTLTTDGLVFTSGGYPRDHVSAIRADGSGELVWQNRARLYVPSLVTRDGYLYGVLDEGIAVCWQAASGKEMWKARLGGTFSSSPVLVGDKIFVSSEAGEMFIFRADHEKFEQLGKNQLGQEVLATPTICGNRIYHRVAHRSPDGQRQETLYCLGSK